MKDRKGHGSNPRGVSHVQARNDRMFAMFERARQQGHTTFNASADAQAAHQSAVKTATEGVQGNKFEPGTANAILHATNSHDRDFHTLRSDQAMQLADYAKQFGYRKSASSPGSTARAFHNYLHNRRAKDMKADHAKMKKHYGY